MINWTGVSALILLAGAIFFSKHFFLFTHFVIELSKSNNILRTNEKIIPLSVFFSIWLLCLYGLAILWFPWVKIIIGIVYDYSK